MSASPTEGTDMNQIEKVARAMCRADPEVRMGDADGVVEQRVNTEWVHYVDQAKAAIAAMQPAPQWYGIETAPRDGTFVLGFGPHNTRGSYREVIHWWGDRWTITWMEGYGEPTHWMPLPTPPAGGSDAE